MAISRQPRVRFTSSFFLEVAAALTNKLCSGHFGIRATFTSRLANKALFEPQHQRSAQPPHSNGHFSATKRPFGPILSSRGSGGPCPYAPGAGMGIKNVFPTEKRQKHHFWPTLAPDRHSSRSGQHTQITISPRPSVRFTSSFFLEVAAVLTNKLCSGHFGIRTTFTSKLAEKALFGPQ